MELCQYGKPTGCSRCIHLAIESNLLQFPVTAIIFYREWPSHSDSSPFKTSGKGALRFFISIYVVFLDPRLQRGPFGLSFVCITLGHFIPK